MIGISMDPKAGTPLMFFLRLAFKIFLLLAHFVSYLEFKNSLKYHFEVEVYWTPLRSKRSKHEGRFSKDWWDSYHTLYKHYARKGDGAYATVAVSTSLEISASIMASKTQLLYIAYRWALISQSRCDLFFPHFWGREGSQWSNLELGNCSFDISLICTSFASRK